MLLHILWYSHALCFFFLSVTVHKGCSLNPMFAAPVTNLTVVRGREAAFTCLVKHLGGYRVGWVKADTKAIQAIHTHVITHNPRVHVSFDDHSTWHLLIKHVTEEDVGPYMCQINTDPMISQIGYLDIITPPEIVDEKSSGDVTVQEGDHAALRCVAEGQPKPLVTWKKEDGTDILLTSSSGNRNPVSTVEGEELEIIKVSREHMGAYLCIAHNPVPPPVSKRIMLSVHFHPVISVPNQLIGAPYGGDVKLQCRVEASPDPVTFWSNGNDEMISNSSKYSIQTQKKGYSKQLQLVIHSFQKEDVGSYNCQARNSMGEVSSTVTVQYTPPPTTEAPSITTKTPTNPWKKYKNKSNPQVVQGNSIDTPQGGTTGGKANGDLWMILSGDPDRKNPDSSWVPGPESEVDGAPNVNIENGGRSSFWPPGFSFTEKNNSCRAEICYYFISLLLLLLHICL